MLVPDSVIDQARDLHPSFLPKLHPPKVLLRRLSRWQRQVVGELLRVRRESVSLDHVVTPFPLASFDAGYDLTAAIGEYQYIHGGDVTYIGAVPNKGELTIVLWEARFEEIPFPSVWIRGQVMYQSGFDRDWSNITGITLKYAPTPDSLTDIAVASVLPDNAEAAAVAELAHFMARRIRKPAGMPEPDASGLRDDARTSLQAFYASEQSKQRATRARVRETWL